MITLTLTINKYLSDINIFECRTSTGEICLFDPFVSCAIEMTDDDYALGKACSFEGRTYVLNGYDVQFLDSGISIVMPFTDGIIMATNESSEKLGTGG